MATCSTTFSTGKQVVISLRDLSHEQCVAVTQETYCEQLVENSSITITYHGRYVPKELNLICNDEDEPRLHLIIQSQYECDTKRLDSICTQIHCDLVRFEEHDRPVYDSNRNEIIMFGSLFNSLPVNVFETRRNLLGQQDRHVKRIRSTLGCAVFVDDSIPQRYRFTIQHENHIIMKLGVVQIQELVRQAQSQYIIAFATAIGRTLISPTDRMETSISPSELYSCPSFTPFQPHVKRQRVDDDDEPTTSEVINDSDKSDDETTFDETRYNDGGLDSDSTVDTSLTWNDSDHDISQEQRRREMEHLLDGICKRMKDHTPKDDVGKVREDSSQIKAYFRQKNASKTGKNESELSIELIEHEIDLRTRGSTEHKCTLVFNKQLKMGPGLCDRLKKTAKARSYKQLQRMTRDIPRENLIIKCTQDKLWKAVIKPTHNS